VNDFLSKKDLQEIIKPKRAGLLTHGDATILTYGFGFSKFLFRGYWLIRLG
jgi:hypothetical protein